MRVVARMPESDPQMKADGSFNLLHITSRQYAEKVRDSLFAYGHDLIGHRFVRPFIYHNDRLSWVDTADIGGQGYDLDPVQMSYRNIVGQDDCRSVFLDFSTC